MVPEWAVSQFSWAAASQSAFADSGAKAIALITVQTRNAEKPRAKKNVWKRDLASSSGSLCSRALIMIAARIGVAKKHIARKGWAANTSEPEAPTKLLPTTLLNNSAAN